MDNLLEFNCANFNFSMDYNCLQVDLVKYTETIQPHLIRALAEMKALEKGLLANIDEERMVGHYWLRDTKIAPTEKISWDIETALAEITDFTEKIHTGAILSPRGKKFRHLIVAGIGGSQLGFQFITEAMQSCAPPMMVPHTIDNCDPEGIERVLETIGDGLAETLVIFISKSGGTVEVKNMIYEIKETFSKRSLPFRHHFVAVTMANSVLHDLAINENWSAIFPTWDWVGGRVSVLSPVGLLPLSLLGFGVKELLNGAKAMDAVTRNTVIPQNPALLLAAIWNYFATEKNIHTMVTLPYKDRLCFFSRYLQQLIMESLGKDKTNHGTKIRTGLTVYGNKGSTDQHAYVQQLREGPCDFFTLFFLVKKDRMSKAPVVNYTTVTSGDYLWAFCLGTQKALFEQGRESLLLTLDEINPTTLGALIALFERAVGFYASMLEINAYNQPGVESGKVCAEEIVRWQEEVNKELSTHPQIGVKPLAAKIGCTDERLIHYLCARYHANHV